MRTWSLVSVGSPGFEPKLNIPQMSYTISMENDVRQSPTLSSLANAIVATCSADQKIKIFRKNAEDAWEPEAEWKVS
jgi:hypothetical protein